MDGGTHGTSDSFGTGIFGTPTKSTGIAIDGKAFANHVVFDMLKIRELRICNMG